MSKTKSNIVAIKMPAMKYSQFLSQKNESRQDREQRRLDFPIRDDSRFISGVGKKHFNQHAETSVKKVLTLGQEQIAHKKDKKIKETNRNQVKNQISSRKNSEPITNIQHLKNQLLRKLNINKNNNLRTQASHPKQTKQTQPQNPTNSNPSTNPTNPTSKTNPNPPNIIRHKYRTQNDEKNTRSLSTKQENRYKQLKTQRNSVQVIKQAKQKQQDGQISKIKQSTKLPSLNLSPQITKKFSLPVINSVNSNGYLQLYRQKSGIYNSNSNNNIFSSSSNYNSLNPPSYNSYNAKNYQSQSNNQFSSGNNSKELQNKLRQQLRLNNPTFLSNQIL